MSRHLAAQRGQPEVSIVVPVYRNEGSLNALRARLDAALRKTGGYEIVFVDDASPDGSRSLLRRLAEKDMRIKLIELEVNVGQHDAALAGMRLAEGQWVVVMDADLQDPPEAIPALLARASQGFDAVFAGRKGRYQGGLRTLTAHAYRFVLRRVLLLPPGAGMFVALRREAARALLGIDGPPAHLVAMIGAARLRTTSVPVERHRRADGSSAYTTRSRIRSGLLAMRWARWAG